MSKQLADIGKRLSPSLAKDALIKVLKQAASLLTEVEQSPSPSTMTAMKACTESLVLPALLRHKDKDVRLLVATCVSEIMRIVAPEAPYEDDVLKDIFHLIVGIFQGLNDVASPSFSRRVNILETVAKVRSCVVMLDLECDDLILEMFHVFFNTASDEHPQNVFVAMRNILSLVLEESEEVSQPLLEVVLTNILKDHKDVSPASHKLAMAVVERCADKLEPYVQKFLTSVMLEGKRAESELQEYYHDIIYEIYRCAPQMLLAVIPNLTQELLTDQIDVRLKAVELLGRLFALPGRHVAQEYKQLFSEFLKRFSDKAVEVRLAVIACAKTCLEANPAGPEASDILTGFDERLLDFDDKVRMAVVKSICELVNANPKWIPVDMVKRVGERNRDKKFSVRKDTLHKLAEVYRTYTTKCYQGSTAVDEQFEWIPSKIVRCCFDKDFRPQGIEIVFTDELFGVDLPVEQRVKHWIAMFASFDKNDEKAFRNILAQKQRLQVEMLSYLGMRKKSKEEDTPELQKRIQTSFKTIASSFNDSSKAEENLQKLHLMKDNNVFKSLSVLLMPSTIFKQALATRDDLLKRIGEKHPQHGFIKTLATKCSFLLFNKEHVKAVLNDLKVNLELGNKDHVATSLPLLVEFASFFPALLEGTEGNLLELLKESDESIKEGVVHVLAKAGGSIRDQISVKGSAVDLTLERLCLEGNRKQAKHAVSAISAISSDSGLKALSVLYGRLVDLLEDKAHLPTILQSLGSIAENAIPIFETREEDVVRFVIRNLLKREPVQREGWKVEWENPSEECLLKMYGVKCLVKSFIPHKDAQLRSAKLKGLLAVIARLITAGEVSDDIKSSDIDKGNIRLAAGKAVLRLARRWDSQISPTLVYSAILLAQDSSVEVRHRFLHKVHQFMKERALQQKYACVFAAVANDSSKEIVTDGKRFLADYVDGSRREARSKQVSISAQIEGTTITLHPEYVLTYLIHILAHQPQFPSEASAPVTAYEPVFRQLVSFLRALVHQDGDGRSDPGKKEDVDNIPAILAIFRTIKSAEDVVDKQKSENLYSLCDIGIVITKELGKKKHFSGEYPGVVPLPSAFYRAIEVGEGEESPPDKTDGSHLPSCFTDNDVLARFRTVGSSARAGQPSSPRGNKRDRRNFYTYSSSDEDEADPQSKKSRLGDEAVTDRDKGDVESFAVAATKQSRGKKKANGESQKNGIVMALENLKTSEVVSPPRKRGRPKLIAAKPTAPVGASDSTAMVVRKQEQSVEKGKGKIQVVDSTTPEKASQESPKGVRDTTKKNPGRGAKLTTQNPVSDNSRKSSSRDAKPATEDSSKQDGLLAGKMNSGREKRSAEATRSPIGVPWKSPLKQHPPAAEKTPVSKNSPILKENELVGCKIKVWWPIDKKFYKGTIAAYDAKKSKHKVLYDDGEVEHLALHSEKWEIVDSSQAQLKKVALETSMVSSPTGHQPGKLKRKAVVEALNNGSQSSEPSDKRRAVMKVGKESAAQTRQGVGKGVSQAKSASVSTPTSKSSKSSASVSVDPFAFHEDDTPSSGKGGKQAKSPPGEPASKGSGVTIKVKRSGEQNPKEMAEKVVGKGTEREKEKLAGKANLRSVEKRKDKPGEKMEVDRVNLKVKGTQESETVKAKVLSEKSKDKVEIDVRKRKLESLKPQEENVDGRKRKSENSKLNDTGVSEQSKGFEDGEKPMKSGDNGRSTEKVDIVKPGEQVDAEKAKLHVGTEKFPAKLESEKAKEKGEEGKSLGKPELDKVKGNVNNDYQKDKVQELAQVISPALIVDSPGKLANDGATTTEVLEESLDTTNEEASSEKSGQTAKTFKQAPLESDKDTTKLVTNESRKEAAKRSTDAAGSKEDDDEPLSPKAGLGP